MNNRIQQRFDRSIRDAVAETHEIKCQRELEQREKRRAQASRLLPLIEAELSRGCVDAERKAVLIDLRKRYSEILAD